MEFIRVWNSFGSFLSFSFPLVCSLLARFSQISQCRVASLAKCSWIKWNSVITEVNSAGKKRVLDDLLLLLIYIKQGWYCINISKYQYLMAIMTIKSEFSKYCVNLFFFLVQQCLRSILPFYIHLLFILFLVAVNLTILNISIISTNGERKAAPADVHGVTITQEWSKLASKTKAEMCKTTITAVTETV